jgi:hypothetical protein
MEKPPRQDLQADSSPIITLSSLATLAIPILALLLALLSGSLFLLDYVHVLTGATWTGIDLFMGLVMSRVLKGLTPDGRVQVIKKLVPIMLFLMPSLASVAITAGVFMAGSLGISLLSPPIVVAGVIVTILSIQGFGILLPTEVRILLELRKEIPDREKVVRLGLRNVYVSGSQAIFQVALILVMAYLATR